MIYLLSWVQVPGCARVHDSRDVIRCDAIGARSTLKYRAYGQAGRLDHGVVVGYVVANLSFSPLSKLDSRQS